jgi:hypothetical protein
LLKVQRWCSPSQLLLGSSLSIFWGGSSLDVQASVTLLHIPRFQWKQMSTNAVFSLVAGFVKLLGAFFLVSWDCGLAMKKVFQKLRISPGVMKDSLFFQREEFLM